MTLRLRNINRQLNEVRQEYETACRVNDIKYSNLENAYLAHFLQGQESVPGDLPLFDENSKELHLIDLMNDRKLILLFPSNACSSCFDRTILEHIDTVLSMKRLLVIVSFDQFSAIKNEFHGDFQNMRIVSVRNEDVKLLCSVNNQPTLLTLDAKDLIPRNHLIFDKYNSILVKKYVEVMAKHFFKSCKKAKPMCL
jgi:thioredoxin-related protein